MNLVLSGRTTAVPVPYISMWQVFSLLTLLALLAGSASANDKPLIFVSVTPQKYLLEKIAGNTIESDVLVQPGHNPHSYDPTARQMARLAKADLLMTTGVPFEQVWLPRIRRLNPQMIIVNTLADLVDQNDYSPSPASDLHHTDHDHDHDHDYEHEHEQRSQKSHGHGHDEAPHDTHRASNGHHGDDHNHEHHGEDPHVWMDPIKALAQARVMTDSLKALLPAQSNTFEQNYRLLADQMRALDREIHEALEDYEGRTFMVFHPAWGHFAARYHLEQVAIEYQGKSPSARQLVALSEKAEAEKIKIILVQEQFNRKPAERIAENIGARVVNADPLPKDLPAAIRELSQQLRESWQ